MIPAPTPPAHRQSRSAGTWLMIGNATGKLR